MMSVRSLVAVTAVAALAACHLGGRYASGSPMLQNVDRGETNGRMFDFVSNRADGDDWSIRLRGSAMYVAYSDRANVRQLGTKNLTRKQADRLWALIDRVDIPSRRKGGKDQERGYVELRLRVPRDDDNRGDVDDYDLFTVDIPRDNQHVDKDVADLVEYLQDLVQRHFRTEPHF